MSTNAHDFLAQLPVPVDSSTPARIGGVRKKSAGPASAVVPFRGVRSEVPKVGLSDICLSYRAQSGERLLALDHINLQVKAGEFLCIVGPSGCGKSTLLHLIAGLHQQTSGKVLIDGKQVQGPGTDRLLIFQDLGLFPWLTVGQNVEFGKRRPVTTFAWCISHSSKTATPTNFPEACGSASPWRALSLLNPMSF
jgi:ABC-type multidrug transport system fused ATPase/permease subunit